MSQKHVAGIRSFNRFYTDIIGLLNNHILSSSYTLQEARVLYELYHHPGMQAYELTASIDMDKGYLSRILSQFIRKKLIQRAPAPQDGRAFLLSLTTRGEKEFEKLNSASNEQIRALIANLKGEEQDQLCRHMEAIREILEKAIGRSKGGGSGSQDRT